MVGQIASPVRWDLCLQTMSDLGVTGVLELPPAGTLTGIAKRALKGVETFALKTPDQLDEARAFCASHGEASATGAAPTWGWSSRRARAPSTALRRPAAPSRSRRGHRIGEVAGPQDNTTVTAAHGGVVVEWLVEDGDLVSPGQPLLRLQPEVAF